MSLSSLVQALNALKLRFDPLRVTNDPSVVTVNHEPKPIVIEVNHHFPDPPEPPSPPTQTWKFRVDKEPWQTFTFSGKLRIMQTLPDNKRIHGVAPSTGVDAKGNIGPLTGTPTIAVSDPTGLSLLQPDPDSPNVPNSFAIDGLKLGTYQVTSSDPADGVPDLVEDITVVIGALVSQAPFQFGPQTDAPKGP